MLISKFSSQNIDTELQKLEAYIQTPLPEQFRQFLRKYNGGITPRTQFHHENISSDIVGFYGTGDVKYPYRAERLLVLEEQTYLAIAFDSFGNQIAIDLPDGRVYFYDHETGTMLKLTDSLIQFFQICRSEFPKPPKSIQEREEQLRRKGRGHIITEELRSMWQNEIDRYAALRPEEVQL